MTIVYRVNAGQLPVDHWTHDAAEGGGRIIGEDQHKSAIRARVRELMGMDGGRGGGRAAATQMTAVAISIRG